MVTYRSFLAAGLIACIAALGNPAVAADSRLTTREYKPDEVVQLDGKLNVQTTIAFAPGERIENVAVGDAESWQVTPNKRADLLFVKPLTATARTNMTVVTDQRTYYFDLVAAANAKPVYALNFIYHRAAEPTTTTAMAASTIPPPSPAPTPPPSQAIAPATVPATPAPDVPAPEPTPEAAARAAIDAARNDVLATPAPATAAVVAAAPDEPTSPPPTAATPVPPAVLTPAPAAPATTAAPAVAPATGVWRLRGTRALSPLGISDDGMTTTASWRADVPLPELWIGQGQDGDTLLNFTRNGNVVVIDGVPHRIVLRQGKRRAVLERTGPSPARVLPSPEVPAPPP